MFVVRFQKDEEAQPQFRAFRERASADEFFRERDILVSQGSLLSSELFHVPRETDPAFAKDAVINGRAVLVNRDLDARVEILIKRPLDLSKLNLRKASGK